MKTETLVLLLCVACGKAEPTNERKRMPAPAAASGAGFVATGSIGVTLTGVRAPRTTQATLLGTTPDWSDAQRRARKIARLVGAAETAEMACAITGTASTVTV